MAQQAHDDRQRDALLVEVIALVLRSMWQWMCCGIVGQVTRAAVAAAFSTAATVSADSAVGCPRWRL
jgi:hypothetical protein